MRTACYALAVAALFTAFPAHARSTVPIVDFQDQVVVTGSGKKPDADQLSKAVMLGISAAGWTVSPAGDDRVTATLVVRGKHTVVTEVSWSPEKFSVMYKDSTNMKFSSGNIHPNYNVWARKLVGSIQLQIMKL